MQSSAQFDRPTIPTVAADIKHKHVFLAFTRTRAVTISTWRLGGAAGLTVDRSYFGNGIFSSTLIQSSLEESCRHVNRIVLIKNNILWARTLSTSFADSVTCDKCKENKENVENHFFTCKRFSEINFIKYKGASFMERLLMTCSPCVWRTPCLSRSSTASIGLRNSRPGLFLGNYAIVISNLFDVIYLGLCKWHQSQWEIRCQIFKVIERVTRKDRRGKGFKSFSLLEITNSKWPCPCQGFRIMSQVYPIDDFHEI